MLEKRKFLKDYHDHDESCRTIGWKDFVEEVFAFQTSCAYFNALSMSVNKTKKIYTREITTVTKSHFCCFPMSMVILHT